MAGVTRREQVCTGCNNGRQRQRRERGEEDKVTRQARNLINNFPLSAQITTNTQAAMWQQHQPAVGEGGYGGAEASCSECCEPLLLLELGTLCGGN